MSNLLAKLLTRSFPGKREEPAEPAILDLPVVSDGSYESRAFALWNEEGRRRGIVKVLDLGGLRAANLQFFSERGMDLGVVNLEPEDAGGQLERFADNAPYQACLAWDLPNFLDDEAELAALGEWLAGQLTTGAPVFLSLATKTPYREVPASYEIVAEDQLRVLSDHAYQSRTQVYPGTRLAKLWPAFESVRSFLLRNGMQEFLLRRL